MNIFKWIVVAAIFIAGIMANLHYGQVDVAYRAAIGIVVLAVALGVAYTTAQGQTAWAFIKSSRTELRKVVWPTRQETVQTALIVFAMVAVTAVILWGIDSLFMWLIGMITGQRG